MEALARESDIQKAILAYLRTVHSKYGYWWANKTGDVRRRKHTTHNGSADILGIWHGQHMEFEVKAKKGVQSEAQKAHQAEVERAGGRYYLVRCVEDVMEAMGEASR